MATKRTGAKKAENNPAAGKICYLCGKEISPDEAWVYVRTRRRTDIYFHRRCVKAGKEDEVKRHMQYKLDRQLRRIEDEQKQKGQDVCTDCFGAAGNDCRDCGRGEDGA